ncbi:ribonucleoside-diphosphate reductase, adenosylcobalamin-dependent [candidate division WWE3 bacterium RIFCSPHIGHO2_01_FULL_40_23]|uniref:Vitamin B12-dependent ribonucleotide reductase n=1 Tax=candidate division WWE3 bacterium RIFCSPLOWO2_01_FULL_41_18 TaxID=1802625 RepID=A0A1F4VEC2_UNCKA|nr:MAG: ribonucleoside-diphosphate reductase, adenosylcobalamin-dependent [candidate division WWE3 bacterium RIFCSPHIGHO2_01_FULL_40_23]OGC55290.1 MAG: ribonucleoside-diphosphate reductase, adenosylcobalamin-dependent [candidate division WWE3 bacterium RIFCSPLOWO2_01_FULL_41_18]
MEKNTRIVLDENSKTVLTKRYLRRGADGEPAEGIEEMFERIARCVAEPDLGYLDVKTSEVEFYNLLTTKKFFPNSPTFTGAGTPLGQLAACFVLPIEDDLGKESNGIFSTLRAAALIQQVGGGNGFSFSRLRPKGAIVKTSNGKATGPVGFLKVYDSAFGEIAQGGARRGANMAVLRVDHPDIRDFISCKATEGSVSNFNISVAVTDAFMKAVESNTTYDLIDPHDGRIVETVLAKEIFDMIISFAHRNGEPGVLFIDVANRSNPVPHLYSLEATNPCGEQWLGPYENCCLGSVNLAEHITPDKKLDWGALKETVILSTRFLDNVVTANKYVEAVPELRRSAESVRRIGLGFMGLADSMYTLGIRYGSREGCEFASQVSEFIRYHSMITSIDLARERGSFKAISGSIYDPKDLKWEPPKPLFSHATNWWRPKLDWNVVTEGIKKYGIRNGAQTTVAPTGTISTVAGCEGYGCEPAFALAYLRNVYQAAGNENKLTLTYTSPLFENALNEAGIEAKLKEKIIDEVVRTGTCQRVAELPAEIKNVFVVSSDITPDEHVMMQASIQAFIDNSLSKTCNFPETATKDDIASVYIKAWKLGCKGITVYVTGTRKEVVLETHETKKKKESDASSTIKNIDVSAVKARPERLEGVTYKLRTPQGVAYINITRERENEPFEVFLTVGKAGSDVSGLAEAMGRLMSGWLRSSRDSSHTVSEIIDQLIGIGGSSSIGFGPNRISSIPDAVAKVFAREFGFTVKQNGHNIIEPEKKEQNLFFSSDMCPDCGNSTLVLEEGCAKCYTCGYSRC